MLASESAAVQRKRSLFGFTDMAQVLIGLYVLPSLIHPGHALPTGHVVRLRLLKPLTTMHSRYILAVVDPEFISGTLPGELR